MKYISKSNGWFDPHTDVELVEDYREDGIDSGLFRGMRNGYIDEEVCSFDEFYRVKG